VSDIDTLVGALLRRTPHVRLTAKRRLVLEVLFEDVNGHYTCSQVVDAVSARGMALGQSTVYRILQWLKNKGVVAQTDLGTGSDVYSLVFNPPHHHLVCLYCGAIADLDDAAFVEVRRAVRSMYHFTPRIEHCAIFGACQACRLKHVGGDVPFDDEV
jgi:Fur family ferric uptake transcriptional regulator